MLGENVAVLIEFNSKSQMDIVVKMLTKETRPDFEDELPSSEIPIFNELEDVEFPNNLITDGEKILFVDWWEIEDELDELDKKLIQCGGKIIKAKIFIEDGMIDPSQDGLYYKRVNDELIIVDATKINLKMPEDFPENGAISQQMQALKQDF